MKNKSLQLACNFAITLFCISPAMCTPSRSKAPVKSNSITGHYLERFSDSTLDVKLLPGGKIKIDLNAYYPSANPNLEQFPGGPNTGETSDTIPIKDGVAVYVTKEFGGKCQITFKFSANKVEIKEDEESMCSCGYGMNVHVGGLYKKLSNRPKFN